MSDDRFDFEDLKVYQKSLDYVDIVYEITKKFPKEEMFSLTNQFRWKYLRTPNSSLFLRTLQDHKYSLRNFPV
ncbi:MAG: four helix bundle protein [Candidatus Brocadiaceae bacterium]|nr:four helix bundle protein [Candidatus Brocadiaceae bacterium]